MENQEQDRISAFDSLYTTNHIQMMKIMLPYFDAAMRSRMAVYIKYMEFQYALSCCGSHTFALHGCGQESGQSEKKLNINHICAEILPFCTKEEKRQIEQLSGLMHSMEMYKEISTAMEMFKQISPDLMPDFFQNPLPDGEDTSPNPADLIGLLTNTLSPEQKAIFEIFGGNHTHDSK